MQSSYIMTDKHLEILLFNISRATDQRSITIRVQIIRILIISNILLFTPSNIQVLSAAPSPATP